MTKSRLASTRPQGRARVRGLAAVALLACASILAAPAVAAPLTARTLASLDRLSDPRVSPDGRAVAYDLRTVDFDADTSRHGVWVLPADGRGPARRLGDPALAATSPRWSPDGRFVYFLSDRSGSDQVWRIAADDPGAAATQVTRLPLGVRTFRLAPDGRRIVVALAVFPDAEDPAATRARQDAAKAVKNTGRLYDRLFVRHWDTWADGTRNHLFALALDPGGAAAGAPVPLMAGFDGDVPSKPFGDDGDFAIAPDGKAVAFSAKLGAGEAWSTNFDLWITDIDGKAGPRDLTAGNPAADVQPVFSPDGRSLAWRAQKRPGFEADRFGVQVMDLAGGTAREIDPAFDRSADWIGWSADGKALLATAEDVQAKRLFSLSLAGGAPTPLTGAGTVSAVSLGGATLVYAASSLSSPDQLWRLDAGRSTRLTDIGAEALAGVQVSPAEPFTFAGWNGETVHGYVVKPYGWEPGRKYPVVMLIHGGPQGSFGDGWSYRWNPQVWAGWGYGVVMIDFHGSTGYGQAFTDAISRHWGDRPLEDLQKGWAAALAGHPFLDGSRACAAGASYGGYMIYWIAGAWKAPWKCLIDHDGVFENRIMGFSTEELWFSEWENGGTPWDNPQGYGQFSPERMVGDWTVPMLIIHSAMDYRIPLEQGLGAFTALQRKGVPSEFLTFPDENHWVLKPQNSVQWHDTVEAWLKRWIGG